MRSWELLNVWDVPVVSWWLLEVDQSEQVCQQQPPARWPPLLHKVQLPAFQLIVTSSNPRSDNLQIKSGNFVMKLRNFSSFHSVHLAIRAMWAYTLDFGTFFLEFFEMKTFWFDVEVLWQIVFVVAGKRKEVIDFFFEKGDMTFDRDFNRRRRGCNLPVQCQWWAHIFVQHQYPVSIGEH